MIPEPRSRRAHTPSGRGTSHPFLFGHPLPSVPLLSAAPPQTLRSLSGYGYRPVSIRLPSGYHPATIRLPSNSRTDLAAPQLGRRRASSASLSLCVTAAAYRVARPQQLPAATRAAVPSSPTVPPSRPSPCRQAAVSTVSEALIERLHVRRAAGNI